MDTRSLAHMMYTDIQKQFDEIRQDPVKRNCSWNPRLYFFAQKMFNKSVGVTFVDLSGDFVILFCENESVQTTLLQMLRDASTQIGAIINANGYSHEFDGKKSYTIAFDNTPRYIR